MGYSRPQFGSPLVHIFQNVPDIQENDIIGYSDTTGHVGFLYAKNLTGVTYYFHVTQLIHYSDKRSFGPKTEKVKMDGKWLDTWYPYSPTGPIVLKPGEEAFKKKLFADAPQTPYQAEIGGQLPDWYSADTQFSVTIMARPDIKGGMLVPISRYGWRWAAEAKRLASDWVVIETSRFPPETLDENPPEQSLDYDSILSPFGFPKWQRRYKKVLTWE